MVERLRAFAALASLVSSTHTTHNSNSRGSNTFFWPLCTLGTRVSHTHIQAKYLYTEYKPLRGKKATSHDREILISGLCEDSLRCPPGMDHGGVRGEDQVLQKPGTSLTSYACPVEGSVHHQSVKASI